ncbi:Hypothetical protein I5071_74190 [Sandaracinus amylolyticus]|nr:Hypothetical protein I5071_74190 [Sandaracinus amylolyticus]
MKPKSGFGAGGAVAAVRRDTSPSSERRALRDVREPGPLEVAPEVRAALARLLALEARVATLEGREAKPIDPRPTLSLEAVDTLEDFLRARLADDALALFAARAETFDQFSLAQVGSRSERAWDMGLGKGRIVLGVHGKHLVCIARRPDPGFALRVTLFDPEDRTESDGGSLGSWLERVVDGVMGEILSAGSSDEDDDGDVDVTAVDLDLDLAMDDGPRDWQPYLERTLVLPDKTRETSGRRVHHPRFGIGVVLRALPESDKLEIDFGGEHGVKVLVSKYVQEVE